jgi:hypothetical protein
MEFTRPIVQTAVNERFWRSEAPRQIGGIAAIDAFDGTHVPKGWKLDILSQYWLPPEIVLLPPPYPRHSS